MGLPQLDKGFKKNLNAGVQCSYFWHVIILALSAIPGNSKRCTCVSLNGRVLSCERTQVTDLHALSLNCQEYEQCQILRPPL